ncbi:MAG: hypothetical protein NC824_02005, partial [Candidatus Omnitrophica bacterium]|nr:hypothetical protein [Candidatus Omnitrophota bacterium]
MIQEKSQNGFQENNSPDFPKESFFGPVDLHLFNEGTHLEIYKKLGAHKRKVDGKEGYNFA